MAARRRAEAVRLDFPRLEPDDAFVKRLADAARASRPSVAARRPLQGLRVGLATAGAVGLSVGGAWAAGNLVEREDQAPAPSPPTKSGPAISLEPDATTPAGRTTPVAPSSRGAGLEPPRHLGKGRAPDTDNGRHVGRPDEPPGRGRDGDRVRPSGLPEPSQQGRGSDHRAERADPGGPKGSGDRRRPDSSG